MQSRNKVFDDLSQLMTNAMGVAQGARTEAETAMKSMMDRWLADRDFVTREEFDAVRGMAQKARGKRAAQGAARQARAQGRLTTSCQTIGVRRPGQLPGLFLCNRRASFRTEPAVCLHHGCTTNRLCGAAQGHLARAGRRRQPGSR